MAYAFNNEGLLLGIAVASGRDNQERIIAGIQASQFQRGSPAMVGAVLMKKTFDRVGELEGELTAAKSERDRLKATPAASPPPGQTPPTPPGPVPPPPFGTGLSTGAPPPAPAPQPSGTSPSPLDPTLAFMALALSNIQNEVAALKSAIDTKGSAAFDLARYMTNVPVLPAHSNSPPMHDKYVTSYNQAITLILNELKSRFIKAFSLDYSDPEPTVLAPAAGSSPPAPETPWPPAPSTS